ncbi:hypothetical protein, partial [Phytoactinopolyspora halophila]
MEKLAERTVERDRLEAELSRPTHRAEQTEREVQELIDYAGGIASALSKAEREDKGALYQDLGLRLT